MQPRFMLAIALALVPPMIAPAAQAEAPPTRSSLVAPPGYTELRVAPPPGGTIYVYEGHRLLGRFDRPGSMLAATGRDYRVVVMRGDTQIWAGDVSAASAPLDLNWSEQQQRFRQPFPPPPVPREPPIPMQAMRSLIQTLDEAREDQDRLEALAGPAERYAFSMTQASAVLSRFRSDAYRLAALDAMRERLIEQDDPRILLDRFKNLNARRFARDLLAQ